MNPESPQPIIPVVVTTQRQRFPIIPQLLVLAFFMFFIFAGYIGSLLIHRNSGQIPQSATTGNTASIPITDAERAPHVITDITLRAEAAFVWDIQAKQALYTHNADAVLPLASITKLMTALLAHELLAEETNVSVPLSAVRQEGSSGLLAGEQLANAELTELALIASSNDAAYALGEEIGELLGEADATSQFVAGMNIRAEELGLKTLRFYNPTGLDVSGTQAGGYGSARDVTFLMEFLLSTYPELLQSTTKDATRVYNTDGAYHTAVNTNDALGNIPNILASKTGFTDLAGGNLTIAFDAGFNRPIIVTVLGSSRDERFSDVTKLVRATIATVSEQTNETP